MTAMGTSMDPRYSRYVDFGAPNTTGAEQLAQIQAAQPPHVHDFSDALHAEEVGNGVIRLTKQCQAYDCNHVEWERFIPPAPAPPSIRAGRAMDPEDDEEPIP
jgi:hypothetical protein